MSENSGSTEWVNFSRCNWENYNFRYFSEEVLIEKYWSHLENFCIKVTEKILLIKNSNHIYQPLCSGRIWHKDMIYVTPTDTTTMGQSVPESIGHEGVLHTLRNGILQSCAVKCHTKVIPFQGVLHHCKGYNERILSPVKRADHNIKENHF